MAAGRLGKANDPKARQRLERPEPPPEPTPAPEPAPEKPAAIAAASPTPDVDVELDGQTFRVSPAVAEAVKAHRTRTETASSAVLEEIKQNLLALRTGPPSPVTVPVPPATVTGASADTFEMPDDRLLTTDPGEYNKQLRASLAAERARIRAELDARDGARNAREAEAARRAAQERLRVGFYDAYPDFRGTERITDYVLAQKWEETQRTGRAARMTVEQGWKEVAAEAALEVAKFHKEARRFQPVAAAPHIEGSAPRKPAAPPAETEPVARRSGLDMIRELKERHGARRFDRRSAEA